MKTELKQLYKYLTNRY